MGLFKSRHRQITPYYSHFAGCSRGRAHAV